MGCDALGLVRHAFGCDVLWELLCGFSCGRVTFPVFGGSRVVFWFQRGVFVRIGGWLLLLSLVLPIVGCSVF